MARWSRILRRRQITNLKGIIIAGIVESVKNKWEFYENSVILFESCYSEDKNSVYCVGHINGQVPLWFLQANVNENRIMSLAETQEKMKSFKSEIGSYVV